MSPAIPRAWWKEFAAVLTGIAAVATVHAAVVVPSILHAAEATARRVAAEQASEVRSDLTVHFQEMEKVRQTLVTRHELEQVVKRLEALSTQLDRIEAIVRR